MPSGGHARSGPALDPMSGRSDRRGAQQLEALPASGFDGPIPRFPLSPHSILVWRVEDKARWRECDESATAEFRDREGELWASLWRTPQAVAWARRPWMVETVAHFTRVSVICEGHDAKAADRTSMRQLRDDLGLSVAGLRANLWQIAAVEEEPAQPVKRRRAVGSRERFGVIDGGSSA